MKLIQKGVKNGSIIDTTLSNRNIPNLELFLNPEDAEESCFKEFRNCIEGKNLLVNHLQSRNTIVILVDSDADGYTSAAMLYDYLNSLNKGVYLNYIVHDGKAHGLTKEVMEEIFEIEPNLVICPDSSSNDVEQIELLENKGIKVLVLDHHHVDNFTDKGTIINNQLCDSTNKNFVGAGVVYKFLQSVDEHFGINNAENYLDLVAIGQIGDSSDISNPEIRKLVLRGINNVKNNFLKVALGEIIGFKKVAPKDMSFSVIPLINAVTRVGTIEERELLFEAMANICPNRIFPVVKKKKNKDTGKFDNLNFDFSLYEYAYDICTKVKNRQNTMIKKLIPLVQESIVDDSGVIIGISPSDEYSGVTGLVANKLVSKYDKPVLLLIKRENSYIGSGRGHEKTIEDFRQWCEDSNLVVFAQGHPSAFGIEISIENFEAFKKYTKSIEKQEIVYEVDILTSKPSPEDCFTVYNNSHLFGGMVSEPLIGLSKISVPKRFISRKGNMLTIYSWGVSLVQFGASEKFLEQIEDIADENIIFDIVGTYSMNEWGGQKKPQLIIKDIELAEDIEEEVNEENIIF